MVVQEFEKFVETVFIDFLKKHSLSKGSISNGVGYNAVVNRDKHGLYRIKFTKLKENIT